LDGFLFIFKFKKKDIISNHRKQKSVRTVRPYVHLTMNAVLKLIALHTFVPILEAYVVETARVKEVKSVGMLRMVIDVYG
jgi:hypothetical protein